MKTKRVKVDPSEMTIGKLFEAVKSGRDFRDCYDSRIEYDEEEMLVTYYQGLAGILEDYKDRDIYEVVEASLEERLAEGETIYVKTSFTNETFLVGKLISLNKAQVYGTKILNHNNIECSVISDSLSEISEDLYKQIISA